MPESPKQCDRLVRKPKAAAPGKVANLKLKPCGVVRGVRTKNAGSSKAASEIIQIKRDTHDTVINDDNTRTQREGNPEGTLGTRLWLGEHLPKLPDCQTGLQGYPQASIRVIIRAITIPQNCRKVRDTEPQGNRRKGQFTHGYCKLFPCALSVNSTSTFCE